MPHRQTVEFLRRRYAAAILCDDADTAGRLRAQLDGIMNPCRSGRPGEGAPAAAQAAPAEARERRRCRHGRKRPSHRPGAISSRRGCAS